MNLKKTVYIIPGFRHQPRQKAYRKLRNLLKKEGYTPVPIKLPWTHRTITENTDLFLKEFKKIQRKKKYILGFSYGAMIAFLASTKVKVSGLILCSLSPFFREDLLHANRTIKTQETAERFEDFLHLKSSSLAKHVKTKQVRMLYGSKESKPLIRRVTRTYKHIPSKRKTLIRISGTDHNIGDERYLSTIHQIVKELN
jgi:hypothetical protein